MYDFFVFLNFFLLSTGKQWLKASATVDNVYNGICINILLPHIRDVRIRITGRHANKISIEAERLVSNSDNHKNLANCVYCGEFKLEGFEQGIQLEHISYIYCEKTGMLFIYIDTVQLHEESPRNLNRNSGKISLPLLDQLSPRYSGVSSNENSAQNSTQNTPNSKIRSDSNGFNGSISVKTTPKRSIFSAKPKPSTTTITNTAPNNTNNTANNTQSEKIQTNTTKASKNNTNNNTMSLKSNSTDSFYFKNNIMSLKSMSTDSYATKTTTNNANNTPNSANNNTKTANNLKK